MDSVARLTEPLRLRARQKWALPAGCGMIAVGGYAVLPDYWSYGEVGWATLVFGGLMAALGVFVAIGGIIPVDLIADDIGIHWRQFLVRRTYRWADISSIGVGRSKVMEPADHPVGRVFVGRQRLGAEPAIGINLRATEADPGRAAYERGFTGFDINIRADFRRSLTGISEDLQQRLETARTRGD